MTNNRPAVYTKEMTVPYYACGIGNRIKLSAMLRYMQQANSEQLDGLGLTYARLMEERMVFLLSRVEMEIVQLPCATDLIRIETEPKAPQGAQFLRYTAFTSETGRTLATAYTAWILVDPQTRRIIRPNQFPYSLPIDGDGTLGASTLLGKLQRPSDCGKIQKRCIRYSDIDSNDHVNNAVYGDIVCDHIPYQALLERPVKRFVIHYQKEARLGDELDIETAELGQDGYYVRGRYGNQPENADCFEAVVELLRNAENDL